MTVANLLALTLYGRLGASSRMRLWQYAPRLASSALATTVQPLLHDNALKLRYLRGRYGAGALVRAYLHRCWALLQRKRYQVVWIEKEALPWCPLWLERALLRGVPYVLDYDDAVFHNYDMHRFAWVRRLFGRRLDGLMAGAALVVAGNQYLAQRAQDAGAPWVEVVPTAIDLDRYSTAAPLPAPDGLSRIVWIGSPSTARYLQLIQAPLQVLAQRHEFVLRVIGAESVDLPGVRVEYVEWAEGTEVAAIGACQVGVMPLLDSPWERGKCGYKLIQYMACGMPVVASPVGVNTEIVEHAGNGFLAHSSEDWVALLGKLLDNAALRTLLGASGRKKVEDQYCIQQTTPRLVAMLQRVAEGRK